MNYLAVGYSNGTGITGCLLTAQGFYLLACNMLKMANFGGESDTTLVQKMTLEPGINRGPRRLKKLKRSNEVARDDQL